MQRIWYLSVQFWVRLAIKLFYRRIEIQGTATYPQSGPVLLAPNHQNAFMDALIPAVFAPRPVHFLVRADVFKPGLANFFFGSLNMMPVYRQRDGRSNLSKNDDVFERCFEILRSGGTLLIFPEASHLGERRLRPLSKGFARIVFGAIGDASGLSINVVPVGLNYSNYHQSQSRLILNWGEPIPVDNYMSAYRDNPNRAMSMLKTDLQDKLQEQIVHIERPDALKAFDIEMERVLPFLLDRTGGYSEPTNQHDFYKDRERTIQLLPKENPYFTRLNIYDHEMEKRKLRAPFFFIFGKDPGFWVIQNLFLLLFLPVFLFAWIIHSPTYFLIKSVLSRYVKDVQFHSSIKLVGNLVLFPVFGFIMTLIAIAILGRPLLIFGLALVIFPVSIFVIRELRLPYRYALTLWRCLWLRTRKPDLFKYLRTIEQDILNSIKRR
jgi:1-acyl-sn-glycerol-3-phosphate acyltransferase